MGDPAVDSNTIGYSVAAGSRLRCSRRHFLNVIHITGSFSVYFNISACKSNGTVIDLQPYRYCVTVLSCAYLYSFIWIFES